MKQSFPIGTAKSPGILILCVAVLGSTAFGAEMRFFPIRSAPLGSPPGTVGDPVTPTFNETLGCWELVVPGAVEVDIDLQAFGWADPTCQDGSYDDTCYLGAVWGTVNSSGYDNGAGAPLVPKGWPASPGDGAYQGANRCGGGGNLDPCNLPFDTTCGGGTNGFCVRNPAWVLFGASSLQAVFADSLSYSWAAAAQDPFGAPDYDGGVRTFGGLILDVPNSAAGTYVIAFDADPNNTFMVFGDGSEIPDVTLTPACITIATGACCSGTSCSVVTEADCLASGGSYLGSQSTCDAPDGDGDGLRNECDGCPNDGNKFEPGLCGCGVDDNADTDADGVADCIDECPGVDDAVFAPECVGAIPAVSSWGLTIMTLLLLIATKIKPCRAR